MEPTSKIRILSEQMINKIAAGEVVERPASIVKELVENAIDAGATQIQVSCKGGGRDLISIVDNGGGIAEEDPRLAITRKHGKLENAAGCIDERIAPPVPDLYVAAQRVHGLDVQLRRQSSPGARQPAICVEPVSPESDQRLACEPLVVAADDEMADVRGKM